MIHGIRKSFLIRNNITNLTQHRRETRRHPVTKVRFGRKNDTSQKFQKRLKIPDKWIIKIQ